MKERELPVVPRCQQSVWLGNESKAFNRLVQVDDKCSRVYNNKYHKISEEEQARMHTGGGCQLVRRFVLGWWGEVYRSQMLFQRAL